MDTTTFAGLGLSAKVLAAVEAAGYTTPTPIQSQAVPVAISGRDVLGIAQTGTGKTAAFVMPMITRLETGRARARMPRSLILAPTRELAAQVAQNFEKYGINNKLSLALLIGGVSMDDQTAKLDRGVDVLIATPGRLLDHFQRGRVMLMGVEILVIDEADRMLDMGFIPDIEKICKLLPPKRQTLFFSATMPAEITRLADQFLKDPVRVEAAAPATAAKTITQRFRFAETGEDFDKREILRDLIRSENVKNAIIFCNRKRDVAILLKSLLKHGFNAGALHGDMDQSSRTATLDGFRDGSISLLAASDVAARGLDIPDVSHIFNFDVPWQSDDYVHRIGRTGRAGKLGTSFTIVSPDDFKQLQDIEKMLGVPIEWIGDAPSAEDIAEGSKRKRGRGRFARGRSDDRSGKDRGGKDRDAGGRNSRAGSGDRPRRDKPRDDRPRSDGPRSDGPVNPPRGDTSPENAPQTATQPADAQMAPAAGRAEPRRDGRPPRRERPRRDAALPHDEAGEIRQTASEPRDAAPRAREPRQGDQPRAPRRDEQPREARAAEQPRESRHREPRREQSQRRPEQSRPAAGTEPSERPQRGHDRSEPRREKRGDGGDRAAQPDVGFADDVPAFLRRPARAGS